MRGMRFVLSVVLATVAFAAMASPASALNFKSEVFSTELEGVSTTTQTFTTTFGTVSCTGATFTGMSNGETFASIRVHPEYTGCKALGFNATVTTTGCDYTIKAPTEFLGVTVTTGIVLDCTVFNEIKVVAAGGLCSINIPPQEMGPPFFTEFGSGSARHIRIEFSSSGPFVYKGVAGFCKGEGSNGKYSGSVTTKGFEGFEQVGFWIE